MALVRLAHKASAVSVGKANRGPYERNQTGWPVPGREATAARKAPGGCFRSLFACSCRQRRPLQWHKWILSGNYFSGKAWVAMKSQGLTGFDAEAVGKYIYVEDFDQPLRNWSRFAAPNWMNTKSKST